MSKLTPPPFPQTKSLPRRDFLKHGVGAFGLAGLSACGGGDGGASSAATSVDADPTANAAAAKPPVPVKAPAPAPTAAPTPAPTPAPAPTAPAAVAAGLVGFGAMQFTLRSKAAQTAAPFALGFAFRQGQVPRGSEVYSRNARLQVTVRNRWPDGSLRFAQLAGTADLPADQTVAIRLETGASTTGTALGLADLKKTGVRAEIDCGAFGKASWADADWDAPFVTWVSGPLMSSWIFRRSVGTDAHLTAWLEVRLYAGGKVEVLPWIENGYLRVASPTNKLATYSFSLGGTQRFAGSIDLKSHQRTVLLSGSALSWWLGTDPGVTMRHDALYLQQTELVPSYRSRLPDDAGVLASLVETFQPLQAGNIIYDNDDMGSSGYQTPIGLLPLHDVCYLTSGVEKVFGAVIRNGYSAGRYGIHYRDETTNRPLRFSKYPTLVLGSNSGVKDAGSSTTNSFTPTVSATGRPVGWDVAHSPSVGYLAYLLSGRFYFMEECQFAATTNYLVKTDAANSRGGSLGLVKPVGGAFQTRSCAWAWRTLTQALTVTPDDDTVVRDEFIKAVEANIADFHATYVAQPNNPFGWIEPGETYSNPVFGSSWQQDFVTAAFGYSVSLGMPVSETARGKLNEFFAWKARSVVRRLGPKGAFWYVNGAPYVLSISPSASPDYRTGKGPWYSTDAEVYAATYASAPAWLSALEGALSSEIMPGERAYWGNLMPALSYAVRHGVAGAQAAYNRVISSSNWPSLRDAFNTQPVWAVEPARQNPSWLAGAPLNTWITIPGTQGAGGSAVGAFSGMAYNDQTGEIIIAAAGGHNDSADNRVVSLRLTDDAPRWQTRMTPSLVVAKDVAYYLDGKPTSRHLYHSIHFVPAIQRVMLFGARGVYGAGGTQVSVDGFNLDTQKWDPAKTHPDVPGGHGGACMIRATGEVWSSGLYRWSPSTKNWTNPLTVRVNEGAALHWPISHDSRRNQLFALQWGDGQGYDGPLVYSSRVDLTTMKQTRVTIASSDALTQFTAEQPTYAGMEYDEANDRFLFYSGQGTAAGRVYAIQPTDSDSGWQMSVLKLAGTPPPATPAAGVLSRFRYIPALKGYVLMVNVDSPLYFFKVA